MPSLIRTLPMIAALGLTLGLASCGGGRQGAYQRPGTARPAAAVRPSERALPTADYFRAAASLDLFEVRSGELAMARSRNVAVRDFARMMITAHEGTAGQLSLAGRRMNLLPARVFQPREQALMTELQAAVDFDAVYIRQQRAVHRNALALHSAYAARGASPTLRPVAANAAEVVRRHVAMLRRF